MGLDAPVIAVIAVERTFTAGLSASDSGHNYYSSMWGSRANISLCGPGTGPRHMLIGWFDAGKAKDPPPPAIHAVAQLIAAGYPLAEAKSRKVENDRRDNQMEQEHLTTRNRHGRRIP
jgi:hypothetical protein